MNDKEKTSSTAFTDHLQKTQKLEMQLLQNFRYRFPQPVPGDESHERMTRTPFKEKTIVKKQEERERKGQ